MKNRSSNKMPLKPYLDAVSEHCRSLSKEELIETMLGLAQEMPIGERAVFLDRIQAFAPKSKSGRKKTGKNQEKTLLERIAVLKEEIEERIESIENGDYWEDHNHWEDEYYGEEDPDYVSSDQAEELADLFLETGGIYLDGRLDVACRLYRALFDLMDENDHIADYPSESSLDLREERARYCRCVYETSDPKRRTEALLDSIAINAPLHHHYLDLPSEKLPMLQDVIDARPGDMPEWDMFLPSWEKRLAHRRGDRADVLRMEAKYKLEGTGGLSKLARNWKSGQPLGYLFWIQCLEAEGNWREMPDACVEALDAIPAGNFREQAAGYLTRAATQLDSPELVLLGRRERFLSWPTESNLLQLLAEARGQNVRSRELDTALALLGERKRDKDSSQEILRVKALLMAGRLPEAVKEASGEKSVGWSYGKAGVLFASLLTILTENSPKAAVVGAMLRKYAETCDDFDIYGEKPTAGDVYTEILTGLESAKISAKERKEYGEWVVKIGRARVEAIVSNQHRDAYERAASVLGALAEYHVLTQGNDKARSLLQEFLLVKFRRHRAFRQEMKDIASRSPLLKDFREI